MPRVSVILNSYNQSAYVAEAVESVLAQTFDELELIVLDNGSTDDSPAVLRRYEGNPRVRLVLNPANEAISRRFNQGVALASGEFISFLYSDDYYLPEKLERQVACFDRLTPDYGVVYGPGQGFNALTGRTWRYGTVGASGDVFEAFCRDSRRGLLDMISPLTRAECFRKYRFLEDVFAEGEGIFFRVALTYKFSHLDEPLAVLRDTGHNAGKAIQRNLQMHMRTLEEVERDPDFRPEYRPHLDFYKASILRDFGWQAVRLGGDPSWARRCYAQSIRHGWRQALHPRTVVGFGLSYLPRGLRARINAVGSALRDGPSNARLVADYGGGAGRLGTQGGRP